MHCKEENIDQWYLGLAYLVKKYNPDAYVLRPGQFYWRKLKYIVIELVKLKLPKDVVKRLGKNISFVKALILYKKLRETSRLLN